MRTFVFTCLLLLGMTTFAQDANFHIYLCLGQSNMEGNAKAGTIMLRLSIWKLSDLQVIKQFAYSLYTLSRVKNISGCKIP